QPDRPSFPTRRSSDLVSPVAILLTDMDGNVREANPVAKKLFEALQLDGRTIAPLMQGDLLRRIRNRESIREVPLDIDTGAGRMEDRKSTRLNSSHVKI